jgi:hypothetical protein
MNLINNELFYVSNSVTYPPFKSGLYLEEFFFNNMKNNNKTKDKNGRLYIPALWTNFQIEGWFNNPEIKQIMQNSLDIYILENPNNEGYFTVVQHDDGPMLNLPENTIIYGACSGNIPIPLIYEDNNNTLENIKNQKKIEYKNKEILCSFVGTLTHNIRYICINKLSEAPGFKFNIKQGWSTDIEKNLQDLYIEDTINSKFALAPRGYGRSSFRFFEIFKLGTIPIYVWDDIEWLPYKDIINYSKICISINISEIEKLPQILNEITEDKYNEMLKNYNEIKHIFELESIFEYII